MKFRESGVPNCCWFCSLKLGIFTRIDIEEVTLSKLDDEQNLCVKHHESLNPSKHNLAEGYAYRNLRIGWDVYS